MGCKYSDFRGECGHFDEDIDQDLGCDEEGNCVCEDDPEPDNSCSCYESDGDDWEDRVINQLMMKCDCVRRIEKEMFESFKNGNMQRLYKKPVVSVDYMNEFLISGNSGARTFSQVEIALKGQQRRKTITVAHTFCPHCGIRLMEEK